MLSAYIYDGLRSPFGRHAGSLAPVRPDDLAAQVINALVERSPFPLDAIEDVILGCACQAGEDSRNVARHAWLATGLSYKVPGQTVNRLCGSGLAAVLDASRAVSCGEGELYVAGGVESMSRAPYVFGKTATPYARDVQLFDTTIGSRFPNPRISTTYGVDSMPETAENVAESLGIGREESDRFAAASQRKYSAAKDAGFFEDEILPISVSSGRNNSSVLVTHDEHVRPETTEESLAKLKGLCAGGVVTAGNASGVNDGAAAVMVGNRDLGERYGVQPVARILAGAVAGVEPRVMGIGPAFAIPKALARAGLSLDQMDVIEINEAFGAQVLGCLKLLGVPFDDQRVNPNGGAIAIGHPLGASGARLALTAARELKRRQGRYAVLSLCIGVGQGIALVIERI